MRFTRADPLPAPRHRLPEAAVYFLVGDGRPLIATVGLALQAAGLFITFQAATGHLLPHDLAWLGLTADQLHGLADGRVLKFMIHDRVAFGGAVVGIGGLFVFLSAGPLKHGHAWSWWAVVLGGLVGFASFLTYLGHGYLDTWHGAATLVIGPLYLVGVLRSRRLLRHPKSLFAALRPDPTFPVRSAAGLGRALLVTLALCIALGGLIIMTVGMTTVFVPQDLAYLRLDRPALNAVTERLIPLIAHDRAGFGGAVCATGVAMALCLWSGKPTPALWQAVLLVNLAGFGTAIGVHYPIGYVDFVHLLPAYLGVAMLTVGLLLTWRRVHAPPAG